ncbi:MAG TPA: PhnD/SsuA/transferrin family substrate-binding protein [Polyangiaceae bacterium]
MITIGAVAYDPKVVTIWEGLRGYFRDEAKLPLEVVLYLSYEAQVDALLAGRIDVAWNTNLAFVQCERLSEGRAAPIAMRDTDLVWESKIVALAGGPVRTLEDLRGKTLALGSRDSGHASILPVHFLAEKGLREGADYRALRFDTDLGKHGDTGTSEVDVLKAVMDGRADAGAVGSPFWQGVVDKKLVPAGAVSVVWTSPPFHHCMFTARVGLPREDAEKLARALFAMKWDDPKHRPILEAEGLKEWVPPHLEGYASLRAAAERQGFFERR